MKNILGKFLGIFKNTINYTIKGIILVLVSYTFKFLTRWATGALPQMLLQFVIMSLGLFILDSLLYLILPSEISTPPEAECPEIKIPEVNCPECPPSIDKCDCNCKFELPPTATITAPVSSLENQVLPLPSNDQGVNIENFASF